MRVQKPPGGKRHYPLCKRPKGPTSYPLGQEPEWNIIHDALGKRPKGTCCKTETQMKGMQRFARRRHPLADPCGVQRPDRADGKEPRPKGLACERMMT